MPSVDPMTVLSAARTGSRVVRYLIRPARRLSARSRDAWERDPWLPPSSGPTQSLRRGVSVVRRAVGLVVLLALGVLGALLLGPLLLLLGFGTAFGSDVAGWLLAFTLLLVTLGAVWTARRAALLIRAREEDHTDLVTLEEPRAVGASRNNDEAGLLALLRGGERVLPVPTRTALRATVLATRDALRLTAGDLSLGRDAYDARQAAREDLPDLLRTYRAAPRTPEADRLMLEQLALMERRMGEIVRERQGARTRTLDAQRRYLESKYGKE
ncbi:hypothetical protein V3W47_13215 [Deinococcus sp. YIM 134068]|uniref:hypothetical protein n=1 Tax=Deinococcus lichenicola TaxID=3118910 RepID=UPI002F951B96